MDLELLADLISRPDDDALRRAHAGRLRARGERDRARFIELQCDLPSRGGERVGEAREEERALLETNGRAWAGPWVEWATRYEFRRGFVESVSVSIEHFAAHERELFLAAPIRELEVFGPGAERALNSPFLSRIECLRLRDCELLTVPRRGRMARATILHGASLRELDVRGFLCELEDLRGLLGGPLPRLETLHISVPVYSVKAPALAYSRHSMGPAAAAEALAATMTKLARCSSLERLFITQVEAETAPPIQPAPISFARPRRAVAAPDAARPAHAVAPEPQPLRVGVHRGPDENYARWPAPDRLGEYLDHAVQEGRDAVSLDASLGPSGVEAVLTSGLLASARWLELVAPPRSPADLWRPLVGALGGPLESLRLRGIGLGLEGARALALTTLPSLRSLHLERVSLGLTGLNALFAWPAMSQLHVLRVAQDSLTWSFGARLALPRLSSVRELALDTLRLSERDAKSWVEALGLAEALRALSLAGNSDVGEGTAEALLVAPFLSQLSDLNLTGTRIRLTEVEHTDWTGYVHGHTAASPAALAIAAKLGARFRC